MELIIKPTLRCNFKCTFCSSTDIADDESTLLDLATIFQFLERFPQTNTIIVNGGDPLMVKQEYYWKLIEWLDEREYKTSISFTSNLWPFYQKPEKWAELFRHPRMGVTTSFQYGEARLKGDLTPYTEEDFWNVSDVFLKHIGYRPDFISVVTPDDTNPIRNVLLAKEMGVECKLNHAMSSGPPTVFKGITIGQQGRPKVLSELYEVYVEIHNRGLTQWEYNTKQMVKKLQGRSTTCPVARSCDEGIRSLQPSGDYYSCGAFADDRRYPIDFQAEMKSDTIATPLQNDPDLLSMKADCFTCPMFDLCNGCRKTISDTKQNGLVEKHCTKMKQIAPSILKIKHQSN